MEELKVCFDLFILNHFTDSSQMWLTLISLSLLCRGSCSNSAVWHLSWSVSTSSVTASLLMIQRSNECKTSTGAGQQPRHRPQRGSGTTQRIQNQATSKLLNFMSKASSVFANMFFCGSLQQAPVLPAAAANLLGEV